MRNPFCLTGLILALAVGACSSGDDPPKCGFRDQTVLADTPWPKFSRDPANTGRVRDVNIADDPALLWTFPALDEAGVGPISNSVLIGDGPEIYLVGGSADSDVETKLYILDAATGEIRNNITPTPAPTPSPDAGEEPPTLATQTTVTASPLLGADGTIYVGFADGTLRRFERDGTERTSTLVGGFISAAPNIGTDGTVYQGSLGGVLSAVCPNGVPSFVAVTGAVQSAAAVAEDRTIIVGSSEGQVRALDIKGRQRWVFFASSAIRSAIVLDESPSLAESRVYVTDVAGRVFAVAMDDGRSLWHQRLPTEGVISASPALGDDTLYVPDEAGAFSAFDTDSGELLWTCTAAAPIRSSPAVAALEDRDIVVFGADDGVVYAVDSAAAGGCVPEAGCACADVARWTFAVEAPVGRASPSLGPDGTVYIGTEGGHLYAIGSVSEGAQPTPTATATPTPQA